MEKIVGFYRFDNKDINDNVEKLFCYVKEDENGKLSYHFSNNYEKIREIVAKYAKDNGFNKRTVDEMLKDSDRFDYNAKSITDVLDKIKRANKEKEIVEEQFMDEYIKYDATLKDKKESKVGNFFTKQKNIIIDKLTSAKKYLEKNKKVKKIVYTTGILAVVATTAFIGIKLNRKNSPTNKESKIATIDNSVQKNDLEEKKDIIIEEDKKEENNNVITQEVTTNSSKTSTTTRSSKSPSNKKASNTTSVNNNYLQWQDPDVSIDNSSNNSTSLETSDNNDTQLDSDSQDNKYENIYEEEIPDVSSEVEDEEYTEVIDVPANSEGKEDTAEDTPQEEIIEDVPQEEEDIEEAPEMDETLDKKDVILDDKFEGNEGAIDNDLSYKEPIVPEDNNEDYEIIYDENRPLPDPNATMTEGNSDYVTTEEELTSSIEVPTVQAKSNDEVVAKAIEAMSNGQEVNILYNTETGTMTFENIPSTENISQTNSLVK